MSERLSNNPEHIKNENTIRRLGKASLESTHDGEPKQSIKSEKLHDYGSLERVDFSGVYPQEELKRQDDYVARMDKKFEKDEKTNASRMAKKFEQMFIVGVNRGDWLGKVDAEAVSTAKYDDYKHRADAVATIKLDNPKDIEAVGSDELVFAIDVTVSGNQNTIREKLTRVNNDTKDELPFGFTSISRYARRDGSDRKKLDMVPRFVVGMSIADTRNTDKFWPKDKNGNLVFNVMNRDTGFNLTTRYKFLSEINSQITAYDSMLPQESSDEEHSGQIARARSQLDIAKRIIVVALNETASSLVSGGVHLLPNEEKAALAQTANPLKKRAAIERQLEANGSQNEAEYRERMLNKDAEPNPNYSDTYTYISKMSKKLAELAQGKTKDIQAHKKIGSHNEAFAI